MLRYLLAALLVLAPISPHLGRAVAGSDGIVIEQPWARASIGVKRPGAAYFLVRNVSDRMVAIVSVATELAGMPQIHETTIDANGVSSMARVDRIEIGPGETFALEPGGAHVMLMRLQRPMTEGETFTLTLRLEDEDEIAIEVPILGLTARGPKG